MSSPVRPATPEPSGIESFTWVAADGGGLRALAYRFRCGHAGCTTVREPPTDRWDVGELFHLDRIALAEGWTGVAMPWSHRARVVRCPQHASDHVGCQRWACCRGIVG